MKVPYYVPWITESDKKSVLNALDQRWLTNGPILKKFESKISNFIGTKFGPGYEGVLIAYDVLAKNPDAWGDFS